MKRFRMFNKIRIDNYKHLDRVSSYIDQYPIDTKTIPQGVLNIEEKERSNLFEWRGQFSPELIEALLAQYSNEGDLILDPFAGSGTVLFEAARRNLSCYLVELNPSAIEIAKTSIFINLSLSQRKQKIESAKRILDRYFTFNEFSLSIEKQYNDEDIYDVFAEILNSSRIDKYIHNIIINTIMRYHRLRGKSKSVYKAFEIHKDIILNLPHNDEEYRVIQSDARDIPLRSNLVDLVITSPPYINVCNYHQYYREVMELLDWDILNIAKSEIGSNRKNRQNRYYTVIQYSVDMLYTLLELRRLLKEDSRLIVVIGRESRIRGIRFENYKIVCLLAILGAGLHLTNRQLRAYTNRFGKEIFEDILHFKKDKNRELEHPEKTARKIGEYFLNISLPTRSPEKEALIKSAIEEAENIQKSPVYTPQ